MKLLKQLAILFVIYLGIYANNIFGMSCIAKHHAPSGAHILQEYKNGTYIICRQDNSSIAWYPECAKKSNVNKWFVSPDETFTGIALDDGTIRFCYITSSNETYTRPSFFTLHHGKKLSSWTIKGQYIGLQFEDGQFKLLDVKNKKGLITGNLNDKITNFSISENKKHIALLFEKDNALILYANNTATPFKRFTSKPSNIIIRNDNTLLVQFDTAIVIFDTSNKKRICSMRTRTPAFSWSILQKNFILIYFSDSTIKVYHTPTKKTLLIQKFETPFYRWDIDISGQYAIFCFIDKTVKMFNLQTKEEILSTQPLASTVHAWKILQDKKTVQLTLDNKQQQQFIMRQQTQTTSTTHPNSMSQQNLTIHQRPQATPMPPAPTTRPQQNVYINNLNLSQFNIAYLQYLFPEIPAHYLAILFPPSNMQQLQPPQQQPRPRAQIVSPEEFTSPQKYREVYNKKINNQGLTATIHLDPQDHPTVSLFFTSDNKTVLSQSISQQYHSCFITGQTLNVITQNANKRTIRAWTLSGEEIFNGTFDINSTTPQAAFHPIKRCFANDKFAMVQCLNKDGKAEIRIFDTSQKNKEIFHQIITQPIIAFDVYPAKDPMDNTAIYVKLYLQDRSKIIFDTRTKSTVRLLFNTPTSYALLSLDDTGKLIIYNQQKPQRIYKITNPISHYKIIPGKSCFYIITNEPTQKSVIIWDINTQEIIFKETWQYNDSIPQSVFMDSNKNIIGITLTKEKIKEIKVYKTKTKELIFQKQYTQNILYSDIVNNYLIIQFEDKTMKLFSLAGTNNIYQELLHEPIPDQIESCLIESNALSFTLKNKTFKNFKLKHAYTEKKKQKSTSPIIGQKRNRNSTLTNIEITPNEYEKKKKKRKIRLED